MLVVFCLWVGVLYLFSLFRGTSGIELGFMGKMRFGEVNFIIGKDF